MISDWLRAITGGIRTLHTMVWGPWTMLLFLATGLMFTWRSRGFQVRGFQQWWSSTGGTLGHKEVEESEKPEKTEKTEKTEKIEASGAGHLTGFQSACTALAATIGTGNIVGVATALTAGGPGALFWMWVCAAIGMMTAYAETSLGQQYRYRDESGRWICGPMIYMERGLGCRWMGVLYAGLAVLASLGMGSMAQSNSICQTVVQGMRQGIRQRMSQGISQHVNQEISQCMSQEISQCMSQGICHSIAPAQLICALVLTGLTAWIICGGIRRISKVTVRLMPLAAGIYLIFSGIVIISCLDVLPEVMKEVLQDAFRGFGEGGRSGAAIGNAAIGSRPMAGGLGGFLMSRSLRYGMSRGVFSNEAGLGSLAVLHGAAEDTTPHQQGMWAMFEVFFDTIVICSLTALVILCIHARMGILVGRDGAAWGGAVMDGAAIDGAALTAWCYAARLGAAGALLVSGAMIVFAFATIIAWYYLGEQVWMHLGMGARKNGLEHGSAEHFIRIYRSLYLTAVFMGCICQLDIVWLLCDLWNGLMAYPNLIALWMLAGQVHAGQ